MKKALLIAAAVAMAALVVAQVRTELRANLTGAGKGKAVWKTRDQIGQLQGELQVEAENLRPGTTYRVFIGTYVWQRTADALGNFRIGVVYRTALRPNIVAGTWVSVKNPAGVTVLSGRFQAQ